MPANDYEFISDWNVESKIETVFDVLSDPLDYPRWWPDVYLSVQEIKPGDAKGVGRELKLLTKGKLAYHLNWNLTVTEVRRPYGFNFLAAGDLEGRGAWRFEALPPYVRLSFDWHVRVNHPIISKLSFFLKPIFRSNHVWAMHKGEESLVRELARLKA